MPLWTPALQKHASNSIFQCRAWKPSPYVVVVLTLRLEQRQYGVRCVFWSV